MLIYIITECLAQGKIENVTKRDILFGRRDDVTTVTLQKDAEVFPTASNHHLVRIAATPSKKGTRFLWVAMYRLRGFCTVRDLKLHANDSKSH